MSLTVARWYQHQRRYGVLFFVRDHDRHLYEHRQPCLTNVLYRSPDAFQFLSGLNQLLPQEKDGHYPRTGG